MSPQRCVCCITSLPVGVVKMHWFLVSCVDVQVELIEEGPPRQLRVTYRSTETGEEKEEVFNTVLFGIGRDPDVASLGLEKAGVKTDAK